MTTAAEAPADPWPGKLREAVAALARSPSESAYRSALDAAYRADDWVEGRRLAIEARKAFPHSEPLAALEARALWRAGEIYEAEAILEPLSPRSRDPILLSTLIQIEMGRNGVDRLTQAAEALVKLPSLSANDYAALIAASLHTNRLDGVDRLIRRALELSDPANGYPEHFTAENLGGMAEYFAAIGPEPVNHIVEHGAAHMPVSNINLPMCEAHINGKGPFRFIVDTGGSITLSLDRQVANDLKLPMHGSAIVRGVGGTDDSHQSLAQELRIGGIRMSRVVVRAFDVSKAVLYSADGVLGTGIFSEGRMTLDFEGARLVISPSGSEPAAGREQPLRRIGDEKLFVNVRSDDRPALALLDTGADVVATSPSWMRELSGGAETLNVEVPAMGVGNSAATNLSLGSGMKLEIAGKTYPSISGVGLGVLDETFSPMLGVRTHILIGMPVFRDLRSFTVDFPRCLGWFDWLEPAQPR